MRWPVIPAIVVGFAIVAMVGLGVWQLQRKGEKEALLARYDAAADLPTIAYPDLPDLDLLYRRATGFCLEVVDWRSAAGRNRAGDTGWQHIASCRTGGGEGPGMQLVAGWSQSPEAPDDWDGGEVTGIIALDPEYDTKLVGEDAVPGLQPVARPSPEDIPNNHLIYAIQWFFFALAAAVIFFLAVRKQWKELDVAPPRDDG